MKIRKILVTFGLFIQIVFVSGCASLQTVSPETPSITLDREYKRTFDNAIGSVVFPAGVYRPNFQTERGIYYLAPTAIIVGSARIGGLFIPYSQGNEQACWLSDMPSAAHRFTFVEGIPYH
jgi:hypothetical protein